MTAGSRGTKLRMRVPCKKRQKEVVHKPTVKQKRTNNTKCKCQKHINITENLESLILKHAPDIVTITETWLTPDIFNHEIAPSNSVIRKGRLSRVGGVALLIKNTIPFIPRPAIADAEAVFSLIIWYDLTIFTSCFYRSAQSGPESVIALQNFMQNLSTIHELF